MIPLPAQHPASGEINLPLLCTGGGTAHFPFELLAYLPGRGGIDGIRMATVTTWVVFIGLAVAGILILHHYGVEIPEILGHGLRSVEAGLNQPLF